MDDFQNRAQSFSQERGFVMRIYQFHFFADQGRRPVLDFADCRHDGEAARWAFAQLNQHDSCQGVEVYEDDRLVLRLERPMQAQMPEPASATHH
ncbi:hypothetical protein ASC65_02565 [Brevundimonas sp. Root1279]|nr:hypothetical protein ASC65_02565 [Brevundimonas sp. Root1279]